jgi:hypothetical protein
VAVQAVQVSFSTPMPSSAHASGIYEGRMLSSSGGALVQLTTPGSPVAAGGVVGEMAREVPGEAGVTTGELVAGGAVEGLMGAAADAGAVVRVLVAPAAVEAVEWPVPHATVLRASARMAQVAKLDVFDLM